MIALVRGVGGEHVRASKTEAPTSMASGGQLTEQDCRGERKHVQRQDYFTLGASRTRQIEQGAVWIGLSLVVMGSIAQVVAWLWMLSGGLA